MAKKYDLTTWEILDYLHQFHEPCYAQDSKKFSAPFTGFAENEITAVEQKYHITFPPFYKKYMMYCGNHPINDIHNHICTPDDILTNYDYLSEDIDEYAQDLQDMTPEEIADACAENEIYRFCQLPKEQWHTLTQEYVLTWYENQGVWHAGYLRSDLEKGIPNPPMYISTNDDFITFEKAADDTETFLKSMLFMAFWSLENTSSISGANENKQQVIEEIMDILQNKGIDTNLAKNHGVNICLDTDTNILYACYVNDNFIEFLVANDDEAFDEEE